MSGRGDRHSFGPVKLLQFFKPGGGGGGGGAHPCERDGVHVGNFERCHDPVLWTWHPSKR